MDWVFAESCTKAIMRALPITLELTAVSFVLSLLLAVFIAVIDYFKVPVLRRFLRSTYPFSGGHRCCRSSSFYISASRPS